MESKIWSLMSISHRQSDSRHTWRDLLVFLSLVRSQACDIKQTSCSVFQLPCPHNQSAATPRLRQIPEDERFAARLRRPDTVEYECLVSSQWESNIGAATSFEKWSAATPRVSVSESRRLNVSLRDRWQGGRDTLFCHRAPERLDDEEKRRPHEPDGSQPASYLIITRRNRRDPPLAPSSRKYIKTWT